MTTQISWSRHFYQIKSKMLIRNFWTVFWFNFINFIIRKLVIARFSMKIKRNLKISSVKSISCCDPARKSYKFIIFFTGRKNFNKKVWKPKGYVFIFFLYPRSTAKKILVVWPWTSWFSTSSWKLFCARQCISLHDALTRAQWIFRK